MSKVVTVNLTLLVIGDVPCDLVMTGVLVERCTWNFSILYNTSLITKIGILIDISVT